MTLPRAAEDRLTSGHRLSHAPPGDEVLITGVSGYFPDSDSVMHLQENLFNKVDLITADSRRWKMTHSEIPQRFGKINNLNKFDAPFFNIGGKQAHTMDIMDRILLEKTYEAIFDAGVNPKELCGSNTGVFVGASLSELERMWGQETLLCRYDFISCSRAMLANRISHWLGVSGPSYALDTACASSMFALEHGFRAIREGRCESAIVCGSNLCINPSVTLAFSRTGVLSHNGRSRCFDSDANGYVRSEAIVVVFLQKAKDSRRAYAQLVYAKTNSDGFKQQGIMFPSEDMQKQLLREFYEECSIHPYDLEFLEAHGTSTRVGDPVELSSISEVVCAGRAEPLKIGSIKSNMGHCETASGLCSIVKMCIAYSTGVIPPNLNYNKPCQGVAALVDGRMEVVTENTPWQRGMAGVNNFGFGGANAHALLKNFAREKVNNGMPFDGLPRLVCVSGRTESAVAKILDDLESRTLDVELVRLLHSIYDKDIQGHPFRGYSILDSTRTKSISLIRDVQNFTGVRRPVWFVYPEMGSQRVGMATELMRIPVFAAVIQKCHKVLEPGNINLTQLITDPKSYDCLKIDENLAHSISIVAMQIGLTDLLKAVGIEPDHITGYGVGKLSCAYAQGSSSAEQTIYSAFSRDLDYITKCQTIADRGMNQNLLLPKELIGQIQDNVIVIEIAPHTVLNNDISKTLENTLYIPLMERNNTDSVQVFLKALGLMYEAGLNPHLANIYPHVPFPVSQGTPMLGHLVEWEHSDDWYTYTHKMQMDEIFGKRTVKISFGDLVNEYMTGHIIDDRNLFPATEYLFLVWETYSMMLGKLYTEVSVVFENVRFQRATDISKDGHLIFNITIHKDDGNFEKTANVVTGIIRAESNVGQYYYEPSSPSDGFYSNEEYLTTKDFYKELKLRGYNHSGLFRGVLGCNVQGTRGRISWSNNWVTFMDCMLQFKIIGNDTRGLYVPTRIEKFSIDVDVHYEATCKMDPYSDDNSFEINVHPTVDVYRSGGVEIRGIHVTSINKRLSQAMPVLEKNEFIANFRQSKMKVEDVLRIYIQLTLENIKTFKVKSIELADEEYEVNEYKPLLKIVEDVFKNLSSVQAELLLISKKLMNISENISIQDKMSDIVEPNVVLFIGANLLTRPRVLHRAMVTFRNKCFIISREKKYPEQLKFTDKYDIVCIHDTGVEYLVLFKERVQIKPANYLKIVTSKYSFIWIEKVKKYLKLDQKLILYSQDEPCNGLLGFVNCLRKELGGENVRCLLITDASAPAFDPDLIFYQTQLNKDLAINIYQNGQWGTYRHLLLSELEPVRANHAYVNVEIIGDLTSLRWLEGSLSDEYKFNNPDDILVHVYCAALNFRDIMTASGRLPVGAIARGRLAQECVQGIEIAGKTLNGTRVMGITRNSGLTNLAIVIKSMLMPIPDEWSFEEAASIPMAYNTVYRALVLSGRIQRGESILIHAGSGGVGQAAINVALHYGCEVFTTVGTAEKRAFIKKLFPQLKDSHIGNSRDTSFEDMIKRETNGRGVDLVLNSLSEDKLQASIRCLGSLGRFLEIGKFDINNNTPIDMNYVNKEISFHSIMLDYMFEYMEDTQTLKELIVAGIASGAVRPLTYCTFEKNEVEAAYRYMSTGKHIGKVIVKIRDEERNNSAIRPTKMSIEAKPRYVCHENHVYILVGGLGGFGLELADWLILRGARKVVLTSRQGVVNGYQSHRLRVWASYGVKVKISTDDITTEAGCEAMLNAAIAMGPVDAIFNLAVILKDATFENQTPESFKISYGPKTLGTLHLDKFSRKMCPELKDFVVFSSVSCGRGNAGQTNYGLANSVMERVCERRKKLNLPALAIQWGAIGDVGLVADMQENNILLNISGTLQQSISSCLLTLDKFLKQDAAIVSSIVVAEKQAVGTSDGNIVDIVARIMGINDVKMVSQQVSLAELGADSLMTSEIKQALERQLEIFLSSQDIRSMTFAKLGDLNKKKIATSSPRSRPVPR